MSRVVRVARAAPADRCRALSSEVLGPQGLAAGGARALGAGFGAPRGELRRPGKSVSLASLTSDEGDGFAPPAARSEDGERWRAPRARRVQGGAVGLDVEMRGWRGGRAARAIARAGSWGHYVRGTQRARARVLFLMERSQLQSRLAMHLL